MNLQPESRKIHELFPMSGNIEYFVPMYQRSYSWKNENIETLFNDIWNENEGYYIGNLLLTPHLNNGHEKHMADKDAYDIVDGQQRLTTIALFLLAIYEILDNQIPNFNDPASQFGQECASLKKDIRRQLRLSRSKISRLHLLEEDQKLYENLLEILDDNKDYKPHRNRIFGKRYKFISDLFIEKFFAEEKESIEKSCADIIAYYEKLIDVEILRIVVSDLTDAFSIFTSFNAKGLPLTLIDLLKSYYLRNAEIVDGSQKALNKWNELIQVFYDKNDEPISMLVTQFLQNFYDTFEAKGTSSITKSQALKEYEKLFAENGASYIDGLIVMGEIFSSFTNRVDDNNFVKMYSDNLKDKLTILSKLECSSIYPVLLFILKSLKDNLIDEDEVIEILKYCINFFIRRNIVQKPKSSNIRAKTLAAIRKLESSKDLNNEALDVIKEQLNSVASNDEEFKSSLFGDIYETSKATTRIILTDLENKNCDYKDKQKYNLDDRDKNGNLIWTIEHIMPQSKNLSESWKDYISDGKKLSDDEIMQLHKDNVHKLGNLTFTGYNSEMGNKDFMEKLNFKSSEFVDYNGLRTNLFLNKSILKYAKKKETWSWKISDIDNRTKDLSRYVLDLYPIK